MTRIVNSRKGKIYILLAVKISIKIEGFHDLRKIHQQKLVDKLVYVSYCDKNICIQGIFYSTSKASMHTRNYYIACAEFYRYKNLHAPRHEMPLGAKSTSYSISIWTSDCYICRINIYILSCSCCQLTKCSFCKHTILTYIFYLRSR